MQALSPFLSKSSESALVAVCSVLEHKPERVT
jgi:hypothetical protein